MGGDRRESAVKASFVGVGEELNSAWHDIRRGVLGSFTVEHRLHETPLHMVCHMGQVSPSVWDGLENAAG